MRVSISPERLLMSELPLTSSRAVHQSFERAATIFATATPTAVVGPDLLVSHTFDLEDENRLPSVPLG